MARPAAAALAAERPVPGAFGRLLDRLAALQGRRALLASFLLGLAAALALPPVHAVPVLLLSFPGLLALLGAAPTWKRAAALGFAWGWGHHLGGLYWVTHAILVDAATWWWLVPLAAPGLALPLAAFAVPPALAAWALPAGWPRLLGFAGAWVLSELARGVLFTGFPWNLMGSVWAFAALPLQGAAVIGVHGLSLLTVLLACLPALGRWRPLAAGGLALLALAGFGAWRLAGEPPPAPPVRLLLVQGNIEQSLKWRPEERVAIFRRYLELTAAAAREAAAAAPPGTRLAVVWPETAIPFLLAQDPEAQRLAASVLPEGAVLLSGTVRAELDPEGMAREVFNSLVALDDAGRVAALYDKAHLVPFGEYMPLAGLIPVRLAAGGMDFSAGPGPVTLEVPGLPPFGALICYEVIFPAAVTPSPRPEWLVNVTNDAWFGHSSGPWQHLATARLRAVEEGLPVARAAQTGISAVFDAQGRRLAMLPLGQAGTLAADLPGAVPPPPFARFGLALPGLLAALLLAGAALGARRGAGRGAGRRAGNDLF
ncbi:apolipoprotein N-acyltransferase [Crenalkalicoccus roseus]|uniref:apolipoprotein N-acyltransferase n=1 Tax=Crenalkalicoccus roseus TaxID=1485588 RepID=UPI0010803DE2|nr:apolipoprotein N-acyltransferase [Crenalkalicoccus roseus]